MRNIRGHRARWLQRLRKTEVEHLYRAVRPQLDIRGLQVAVDDALLVCGFEGLGDLFGDGEGLVDWNWPLCDAVRERRALHQLHHEGARAARFFNAVNRGDMWMIQRGEDLGFALKPGKPFRIGGKRFGEDLECDIPFEPRVARTIHLAHPARPEGRHNLMRTESGAGKKHGHETNAVRSARQKSELSRETVRIIATSVALRNCALTSGVTASW